jgi:hypothetical protein
MCKIFMDATVDVATLAARRTHETEFDVAPGRKGEEAQNVRVV